MKIQCSCGAKHHVEVRPEMAHARVTFVCPSCGLDASDYVTSLVHQQLGSEPAQVAQTSAAPQGMLLSSAPETASPAIQARIHTRSDQPPSGPAEVPCPKHPGFLAVEKCFVCSKPICPKCMELFGYLCSPLCKAKADSHGLNVPVYEGQKSVIEARFWQRMSRIGAVAGSILALLLGFWIWYAWFGSTPKPAFSVRFPSPSYSGQSFFAGPDKSAIVFLHGGTLARYDLKTGKQVWSRSVIDADKVRENVAKRIKEMETINARLRDQGDDDLLRIPSPERMHEKLLRAEAEMLQLHVHGENVWVGTPGKLVNYAWENGAPKKEIPIPRFYGRLVSRSNELLVVDTALGKPIVTTIDLAKGESRTEELGGEAAKALASSTSGSGQDLSPEVILRGGGSGYAGLPLIPGKDMDSPMDPARVAQEAQRLSLPARIALPAVLSSSMTHERALAEMREGRPRRALDEDEETRRSVSLIPTRDGFVQFSAQLLESRIVEHDAMKPASGKSVLDGPVSVANTLEAANEILNEMQRSRGGGKVYENLSRYAVTIEQPGTENYWSGEVIGPPRLYPLETVNVLAGSKMIHVLDKQNRKLWQSPLNYDLPGDVDALDPDTAVYGLGPCADRNGSLYVFDEGVLTAFDLKTGNARWRLPSVGIVGMFFDDQQCMYLNTSTASPDSIRFSRQIDISKRVASIVMKVDCQTGKPLWSVEPGGMVNYVSGKFVYTFQSYMPPEPDEDDGPSFNTGFETPPYMRIRRINPRSGSEMWEHFDQRAPLDVQFDGNTIRLVFKKEVQVLKFLSF